MSSFRWTHSECELLCCSSPSLSVGQKVFVAYLQAPVATMASFASGIRLKFSPSSTAAVVSVALVDRLLPQSASSSPTVLISISFHFMLGNDFYNVILKPAPPKLKLLERGRR